MSTGALDMGGASMQIAFQQSSPPVNHSFTAELFGQNFNLYSRSYLCFGVNEAFRRTLAYLTKVRIIHVIIGYRSLMNTKFLSYDLWCNPTFTVL